MLERTRGNTVTRAHYMLNATSDGCLEGGYYEEGLAGEERTNMMRVRVVFDDHTGHIGSFQLARVKHLDAWKENDGEPQQLVRTEQPEPRTVFKFAFVPQVNGRFWISESRC